MIPLSFRRRPRCFPFLFLLCLALLFVLATGSNNSRQQTRAVSYVHDEVWWQDEPNGGGVEGFGGGGGASSDDEAENEELSSSSDDEAWNRLSASYAAVAAATATQQSSYSVETTTITAQTVEQPVIEAAGTIATVTTVQKLQQQETVPAQEITSRDKQNFSQSPFLNNSRPITTAFNHNEPQDHPASPAAERESPTTSSAKTGRVMSGAYGGEKSTIADAAGTSAEVGASSDSPPMQTSTELQQMLDETDYMTSNSARMGTPGMAPDEHEQLWKSKDRAKYKRVQNRMPDESTSEISSSRLSSWLPSSSSGNRAMHPLPKQQPLPPQQQHAQQQTPSINRGASTMSLPQQREPHSKATYRPSPPIYQSDDEQDHSEDTDYGLGYTLPNLPVYYSDGEELESAFDIPPPNGAAQIQQQLRPYPDGAVPHLQQYGPPITPLSPGFYHGYPLQQQGPPLPHHHLIPLQQQYPYGIQQQQNLYGSYGIASPYQTYGYQYPYPPPYITQQQHADYSQYGPAGWNPYHPAVYTPQQQLSQKQQQLPGLQQPPPTVQTSATAKFSGPLIINSGPGMATMQLQDATHKPMPKASPLSTGVAAARQTSARSYAFDHSPVTIFVPPEHVLPDASRYNISFDSFQKIALMLTTVALACYAGVSPRTLPLSQYNLRFYENLGLVSLATLAPILQCLLVVSPRENNLNAFINTFFTSFTLGYLLTFGLEIVATTIVRLVVFTWFEPKIFSLAPKVPIPIIPWVLRETGYRPKRITLLAAEIAASCVVCPVIEEFIKLKIMQWSTPNLKRNFVWSKKISTNHKKTTMKWVADPIIRPPSIPDIVSANQYVSQMLAASLGLKLCDAGRRILLYTKRSNPNKAFYALFRGLYPIQELCGTISALGLAKRNLLGVRMPTWKILLPAVIIHGMANFRGTKPINRWGSQTPWSEMQLPAFHVLDSSPLPQLLSKAFAKLMWFIIVCRVTGYCVKNYYMLNRQAVKRTTTYAGKPAAFSAELTTTEMLKKK